MKTPDYFDETNDDGTRYDPALIQHVPGDGPWPLRPAIRTSRVRTERFSERVESTVLGHKFVYYEAKK